MSNRTTSDVIGSLRREAREQRDNRAGVSDLMVEAADEIERLRSLVDETTAKWAAFSHECYTTHYMLPEGGCGVYLDGFMGRRPVARRDEIRRLAGLPKLPPSEDPTQEEFDAKVAASLAAKDRNARQIWRGPADFPLVGDEEPLEGDNESPL